MSKSRTNLTISTVSHSSSNGGGPSPSATIKSPLQSSQTMGKSTNQITTSQSLENWDTNAVASWISSIGFSQYEKIFKDNEISGDILLHSDQSTLKELQISSVGHRLAILKGLHKLKEQAGFVDIDADGFFGAGFDMVTAPGKPHAYQKLEDMIRERDYIIDDLAKQIEEIKVKLSIIQSDSPSSSSKHSNRNTLVMNHDDEAKIGLKSASKQISEDKGKTSDHGTIKIFGLNLQNHENESYKTIPLTIHDNCGEALSKALKKWKIDDDWRKYDMVVSHNGKEKCIDYDDKPYMIYLSLSRTGENPRFSLRLKTTKHSESAIDKVANLYSSENASDFDGDKYYIVKIPYKASRDDEIDLNVGDHVAVVDKHSSEWWIVEINGNAEKQYWAPSRNLEVEKKDNAQIGTVLHDYKADGNTELTVFKGDIVNVRQKHDPWLLVRLNGKEGWVPSSYVSYEGNRDEHTSHSSSEKISKSGNSALSSPQSPIVTDVDEIMPSKKQPVFNSTPSLNSSKEKEKVLVKPTSAKNSSSSINNNSSVSTTKAHFAHSKDKLDKVMLSIGNLIEDHPLNEDPEMSAEGSKLVDLAKLVVSTLSNLNSRSPNPSNSPSLDNEYDQWINILSQLEINHPRYNESVNILENALSRVKKQPSYHDLKSPDIQSYMDILFDSLIAVGKNVMLVLESKKRELTSNIEITDMSTPPSFTTIDAKKSETTNLVNDLVQRDNKKAIGMISPLDPSSRKEKVIPYEELVKRTFTDPEIDSTKLERYLSNEDCIKHLGCTKAELELMPQWQILNRKRRANLA